MKTILKQFILITLSFFLACNSNSEKKSEFSDSADSNWRSSRILIQPEYYSVFEDSLNAVRSQTSFASADSALKAAITYMAPAIEFEKFIEILAVYKEGFGELPGAVPFVSEEQSVAYLRIGELDSLARYAQLALNGYKELKDKPGLARSNMILASYYSLTGDFAMAYKHQFAALDIYKTSQDSVGIYNTLAEVGINCFNEHRFERAEQILSGVLAFAERQKDTFLLADMLNNRGTIYHQLGRDDDAKLDIERSIEIRTKLNDDFGLSQAYGGMAMVLMSKEKWSEAVLWNLKSIQISEEIQDYRNIPSLNFNLGVCYLELNELQEAEEWFLKVINETNSSGKKDFITIRAHNKMADLMKKSGSFSRESEYLRKAYELNNELFNEEKLRITEEIETKYKVQEKGEQLLRIQEENKQIQERKFILIFGLIAVVGLAFSLIIILAQRNKSVRKLYAAEQKLRDEEVLKIQRELEYNREQLNDFTHHLVEKNRVIFELEKKVISNTERRQSQASDNGENQEEYTNLLQLRILTDDDWSKFKMYFDKVFPGLILQLRQKHSNLTGAEERLFLLLKLKTDSREMADMLGISMESVRKNKYRLKKKLSLNENEPLEDYINLF